MRAFCQVFLGLSIAATGWAAETRTGAATMDPYLPIRNSALHFELGVNYANEPGFYASGDSAAADPGKATGTEKVDFPTSGSLTTMNLKIRHGFVAGTEALIEIPYSLASGDSRRIEPVKEGSGVASTDRDTSSSGFGDWTFAVKSVYEPWGLGGYFGVILPVGEIFGSNAYTNGDGQINMGLLWGKNFPAQYFGVLTNFVYGYDLPATNRKIDKQDSYSFYLRLSGLLMEERIRPYLAYTYEGYGEYVVNKETQADAASRQILTPGIDANLFGDFSAELSVPVVLAGEGNQAIATTTGWGVNFAVKYFWYRF